MANLKKMSELPRVVAFFEQGEVVNEAGESAEKIWEVILNIGAHDGIEMGQMFLIYALGPEITDPSTGRSLGAVDIVRGRGRVIYVQDNMCRVRSSESTRIPRFQQNALAAITGDQKAEFIDQPSPFYYIAIGDLARRA